MSFYEFVITMSDKHPVILILLACAATVAVSSFRLVTIISNRVVKD